MKEAIELFLGFIFALLVMSKSPKVGVGMIIFVLAMIVGLPWWVIIPITVITVISSVRSRKAIRK
jgi:hypothetical protein